MSRSEATVRTSDLGEAVTYLEGLVHLARRLAAAQGAERIVASGLARELQEIDTDDPRMFDPLRYESASPGIGWAAVASNVETLRQRLVESYGSAAL